MYKVGDDLIFDFHYIESKLGKALLTVTVKAAYRNGTEIVALAGAAVSESGNGLYRYVMAGANNTVTGNYVVIATTATATVDQRDIAARNDVVAEMAFIDAAISGIPAAVWNVLTATLTTVGSIGKYIVDMLASAAVFPAGAIEFTYTLTSITTGLPIADADIWITTDLAGLNVVWRGTTDAFGIARDVNNGKPWLDAGTYYFWRQRSGYTFTNPDTEVVS